MALEMGQGDEDIGIHDGASDLCFLYVVTIDGHQSLIGAL